MPTDDRPLRVRDAREPADRPACPRCGARMGVLDAGARDGGDAAHYCGCCGLVMPAPTPPASRVPPPDAR